MNDQERIVEALKIIRSKLGAAVNHQDFLEEITFYSDISGGYYSIRKMGGYMGFEINHFSNGDIEIQQKISDFKSLKEYADWLEKIAKDLSQVAKTDEEIKAEKIATLKKQLEELEKE